MKQEMKLPMLVAATTAALLLMVSMAAMVGVPPQGRLRSQTCPSRSSAARTYYSIVDLGARRRPLPARGFLT